MTISHQSVPNLPKRVVDMANGDIIKQHEGRKSVDLGFINSVFEALDRVKLELIKGLKPNQMVASDDWKSGFVPKGQQECSGELDSERLLIERESLRSAGDYSGADAIRQRLISWGYRIEDEKSGSNWILA